MYVILKIGGSAITDKTTYFNFKNLNYVEKLAKIIKRYTDKYKFIIVHGGGNFAHRVVKCYGLDKEIKTNDQIFGISLTKYALLTISHKLMDLFIRNGLQVYPIETSDIINFKNSEVEFNYQLIENFVKNKFIPILHGDITIDFNSKIRIISGDLIAYKLCTYFKPKYVIFLTDTEGVYTNLQEKKLIKKLNIHEVNKLTTQSFGIDVTGGIFTKLKYAFEIAKLGVKTYICAIYDENSITNILNDLEPEKCTEIII